MEANNLIKLQKGGDGTLPKLEIEQGSTLTLHFGKENKAGTNDGNTTVVLGGTLNFVMSTRDYNPGSGNGLILNYGSVNGDTVGHILNLTRENGTTANRSISKVTVNAALDAYNSTTDARLHEVTLATFGTGTSVTTMESNLTKDAAYLDMGSQTLTANKRNAGQYTLVKNASGIKLCYVTADIQMLTWDGGDLTWQEGAQMTGGTYANGDRVTFTADSDVTLGGAVSDSFVIINSGANVRLGRSNGSNQLDAKVQVDGTLTLLGAVLADNTRLQGSGTLVIDSGSGDINLGSQFGSFAGTVDVNSGRLTLSAASPVTVRVHDGGQAYVNTNQNTNFEIEGSGWTASSDAAKAGALRIEQGRTLSGNVRATGDASIIVHGNNNTGTISGAITGEGTLTKNGGGTLNLTGHVDHTGTLLIKDGTVGYGTGQNNSNRLAFDTIQIDGGQLRIEHAGANLGNLVLNGGKLYSHDQDNTAFTFRSLNVTANSTVQFMYNGTFDFRGVTGSAQLTIMASGNTNNTEAHKINMLSIDDYNGTIDASAVSGETHFTTTLGAINQAAGNTLTLKGKFSADNFATLGEGNVSFVDASASNLTSLTAGNVTIKGSGDVVFTTLTADSLAKTGEGTLSITNLTINHELTMGYAGDASSFSVTNYSLADNVALKYEQSDNYLTLATSAFTDGHSVMLDLAGVLDSVMSEQGFNLHISSGIDKSRLTTIGLTGVEITDNNGYWNIKATGVDTPWDINWGGKGLNNAPTSVPQEASPGTNADIYLGGTAKEYTAPAEGSSGERPSLFGGTDNTAYTGKSWLKVTGGDYNLLVGGNNASRWQSSQNGNFNGISHILMEGGSANHVIGGNLRDGYNSVFNGDSYITIDGSAEVGGSIIGGTVVSHNTTARFTGDTHIFIRSLLGENRQSTLDNNLSPYMVIGGSATMKNYTGGYLTGNTNIDINLSGVTVPEGGAVFHKMVVGGNAGLGADGDLTVKHDGGGTYVTVTGKNGITFAEKIIGGDWMGTGQTAEMTGHTHVTLDGGTYSQFIVGGSGTNTSGTLKVNGTANLTIASGTFNNLVIGGNYEGGTGNATSTLNGGSYTTLNGGVFNNHLAGGDYVGGTGTASLNGGSHITIDGTVSFGNSMHVFGGTYHNGGGTSSITGGSSVTLANGSVHNLVGGSFLSGNATASVDSSSVTVSGGTVDWSTVGGLYIGSGDAAVNASIGDIQVTISGGSVKDVIGGSFVERNSASSTVQQGNITVDLTSGSINGTVYAAGRQQAGTVMETASTTVNFGNGFTWVGGRRVTGDYFFTSTNGVPCSGSTVTGNRTLNFTDTSYTSNLNGVAFEKFDVVNVLADASVTPTSFSTDRGLTKTGAGELVISGAEITGTVGATSTTYNVQGGTLTASALGASQSFSVASNATAQIKNTGAAVSAASVTGTGAFVADTALVTVASNTGFSGTYTVKNGGSLSIGDTLAAGTINLDGTGSAFTGNGATSILNGNGGTLKGSTLSVSSKFDVKSGTTILDGTTLDVTNHTFDLRGSGASYSGDLKLLNRSTLKASGDSTWINEGADSAHRTTIYVDSSSSYVTGDFQIHGRSDLAADALGSFQYSGNGAAIGNLAISGMSYNNAEIEYTGTGAATLSSALTDSDVTVTGGGTLSIGDKGIHALSATSGTAKATGRVQVDSAKATGSGVLEISGGNASLSVAGSYSASGNGATMKNVTLSSGAITGATSGTGSDIKALGEMASLTLEAAAAMDVSNITMKQSSIAAGDNTITYSNVMAVATADKPQTRAAGPAISTADGSATLTEIGTTVQTGGAATGTLTVDIAYALLDSHRGGSVTWTIFDNVDITDAHLQLGDVLTTIVNNGLPVVQLKVGNEAARTITAASLQGVGGQPYDLLAGYTGSQVVVLTVENIPEPATGALSVLALAALAARRRRKQVK